MGHECGRRGIGHPCRGHDARTQAARPGLFDDGRELTVVAGAGREAPLAGQFTGCDRGRGVGAVGNEIGAMRRSFHHGLYFHRYPARHLFHRKTALGSMDVITCQRDLLFIHAVADHQYHVARLARRGCRCGAGTEHRNIHDGGGAPADCSTRLAIWPYWSM